MRKWWIDSISRVGNNEYEGCRVDDPCIFDDPTIEYEEFLAKLSGSNVNMATLRDALDTPSMMNRHVLCPWGCSSNVRTSGRVGFDVILQRIFQSIIIKPTSPNKGKYETQVQTSWEQYVRDPDDYDSVMYNHHMWRVKPQILFNADGPFVLTCPHHNNGTPHYYLYPPRSPHLFNAPTTDQISPIVVKPRIKKPIRAKKNSTTFAMHQMQCSFAGADTMDLTQFNDFSARTKSGLAADHYALITSGRPDILMYVQNLEKKHITEQGFTETCKVEANRRYPKELMKQLAQGATYTTFADSMAIHLEGDAEISAVGMHRRRNNEVVDEDDDDDDENRYKAYDIKCRCPWAPKISLVQMEDNNGYGIQPHPVPQFNVKHTASVTTWMLSALLVGSKEMWDIVHTKPTPFHVWGWEGWLLTYLDADFPYVSKRADPKSPFKKAQISAVKGIVTKIDDFKRRHSSQPIISRKDEFERLFPPSDYPTLSIYDEYTDAMEDPLLAGKRAFLVVGYDKPESEHLQIGNVRFELRVILKVDVSESDSGNVPKFDAIRYMRYGNHFDQWFQQERGDAIVTRVQMPFSSYNLFESLEVEGEDDDFMRTHVFLYVNCADVDKEEYRLRFHESMGGQIVVRCSCNGKPLIPSGLSREKKQESNARCNCPHNQSICKRFESYVCSDEKCGLRVCKTCFDKHSRGEMNEGNYVSLSAIQPSSNSTLGGGNDDEVEADDDDEEDNGTQALRDDDEVEDSDDEVEIEDDGEEDNLAIHDDFDDSDTGDNHDSSEDNDSYNDDDDDYNDDDNLEHDNVQTDDGTSHIQHLDQDLENFLVAAPDMLDYDGVGGSQSDDNVGLATTNAGDVPIRVLPADNHTQVNGHVILNQVAACTRRGQHVISGTQRQKNFVQKYTHSVAGVSYPLMYIEASQFPRHFHCTATNDPDAILGARALPFYSNTLRPFGIASVLEHARARITCPSSTTSTDQNYHFHLWDVMANFTLSGNDSRDINERGFVVDPKSPMGLSVRAKGESGLSGDIDSCQMVRKLGASQKYVDWSLFITLTLNQSGHPGVKHLHEWKESKKWLEQFMSVDNNEEPIASEKELTYAFEKIYAPHCFSNWMETRYLLIQFIKENITHLGATTHLFSRDEYQDDVGNVPHMHLIMAVDFSHLGIHEQERILEYVSSLVATSAMEILRPEDIISFREEGLLREVGEEEQIDSISEAAKRYLRHECKDRCMMRKDTTGDKTKDLRCRKLHSVKDHPDPHRNVIKEIPYPFCQETIDILEECGKYDSTIICQDATHGHSCTNCKFLHKYFKSRRFMVKCNPNAEDNMSPVDRRLFTVCDSMQNLQILLHTAGLCKYLVKYLVKRDKVNRAMAFADVHTGDVRVGKERIHNSKIATSNYNEEKAFEKSRMKDHDTGRDISHMEIIHVLLGYPEIITNCVFTEVSTQPFCNRPKNRVRRSAQGKVIGNDGSPRSPDAHHAGIPMKKLRDDMGFISCRKMTATQELTYRDHGGKTTRYDEISLFGLRPSELVFVVENPADYFRFFHIDDEETEMADIRKGMSVEIENCLWFDFVQRGVRIRHLAKNDLQSLVKDNIRYYEGLSAADDVEKKEFAIKMNKFVLALTESNVNPKSYIHYDGNEMLPIPVLTNVSPMNSHNFLVHVLLSFGKYITEKDILLHRTSRECFRAARLVRDSDDVESLKEDAIMLMTRYIDEQLVFYPNSYRLSEVYLQASRQFFEDSIVHNELPMHELPPYTMTAVFDAFNEKFDKFWPDMISTQIDSCLNTLSSVDGIPSKERLISATRDSPDSWDPLQTFNVRNELQSQASFEEQSLAITAAKARIDRYIREGKGMGKQALRYIKNFVVHGAPGTGKSFVTQVAVLYAVSKGLRVMSTALMSVRAIVIGGIHLHKLLCLKKGNRISPFKIAEAALQRIHRKQEYLYAIQTVDVLFVDEIGQISSEFLSVIDIVFRHARDSRTPFGGCLVLASMDHRQIPPINELPFLLSSLILTSFDMVELRHSVRAHSDEKFQRFQQILRMNVSELIDESTGLPIEDVKNEFDELIDDPSFIRFVDGWDDPGIAPGMARIYSRKSPAKSSISDMIISMQSHLDNSNTPYSVATARDLQKNVSSHGEWRAANASTIKSLNNQLKEPDTLLLTAYCMYEFTVNSTDESNKYSQSQDCLLINVPEQSTIDRFQPFKVLAAPPGRPIEFDFNDVANRPTRDELLAHGWVEVTVRCAPEQIVRSRMFQGKRQQYFLKHKGAYTINKSQGETLFGGVAVEITVKYSPWQKGQVVVVFSRSTKSELMVVVGNRQFTKKKLWELITQRTQWCQLMDAILHLVTINNEGDDMPTLDYTTHYPFTISNIPIPREDGGYVYILISVRDTQQIYIGSTGNLAIRFRSHNSGSGSNSTNDHMLRPWALAGYISGLPSDSGILCQYEQKFKEFIDDAKARGVHDVFSWVYRGGDVAALYNSTISEEQGNSARFVITIERGQLNNNRSL